MECSGTNVGEFGSSEVEEVEADMGACFEEPGVNSGDVGSSVDCGRGTKGAAVGLSLVELAELGTELGTNSLTSGLRRPWTCIPDFNAAFISLTVLDSAGLEEDVSTLSAGPPMGSPAEEGGEDPLSGSLGRG